MLAASGATERENTCASRKLKLGNDLKVASMFALRPTPVDSSELPGDLDSYRVPGPLESAER